ncbi:uncharacterized protein C2orf73 homolog [Protobothrops mucrosquamatus]|uniref:uncharacterized protein C2orf73 homolog n=1 Tax=Protobothrops mucrosquamatus TaxID=103944 RepID=UPI0010FB772B|nr:uncharacterized protein C2orf73 homolog [Protobothrops mucrosquamatus]
MNRMIETRFSQRKRAPLYQYPDTFRIFNLQVPERNNILDKIERTPKKQERYLLEWRNNPQPQHAKLLRMHTKFINEPVLYMETEDTKTKQSHWWPTFEPTVEGPKPPYDKQSTHRNDFQKPNCILSRPVKHPSKLQPSYGIVPLASPQLPSHLPRIFQEQLTFKCNYNARETPCIPYQGKKQGTIVLTEKKTDGKIMPSIQGSDLLEDLKSEKGAPVKNGVTSAHVDSLDAQKISPHSDAHLSKSAMNLETKADHRTPEMDQESSELPQTDKVDDTCSPSKTISLSKPQSLLPPLSEAAQSIPGTQVV